VLHDLGVLERLLLDLVNGIEIDLFLRGGDEGDGHAEYEETEGSKHGILLRLTGDPVFL
jgi:hypothetical protein